MKSFVNTFFLIIIFNSSACGTTSENVEDFVICLKEEMVSWHENSTLFSATFTSSFPFQSDGSINFCLHLK